MKFHNLALACATAMPALACAQSSVSLYGVVDTGIEYVNHIGTASNSVVRMNTLSGMVPSRWGLFVRSMWSHPGI